MVLIIPCPHLPTPLKIQELWRFGLELLLVWRDQSKPHYLRPHLCMSIWLDLRLG